MISKSFKPVNILLYLPLLMMVVAIVNAFWQPVKVITVEEAVAEITYLLLSLYALKNLYHLRSFLIIFGWQLFCLGLTLDVLDEFVAADSFIHKNLEEVFCMAGILLFSRGFQLKNKSLKSDLLEVEEKSVELSALAYFDKLTGLSNRAYVIEKLDYFVKHKKTFSLHFIDLNKFKPANDTYGHEVGDRILKITGARLQSVARKSDIVARWGGDEFVVIQSGNANEQTALTLAHRMYDAFDEPFNIDKVSIAIGASIGVAIYPQHGATYSEVLKKADLAMYVSKQNKDKPKLFDGGVNL